MMISYGAMKKKKSSFQKKISKLRGDEREGLIVATFGAEAEIEDEYGSIVHCHLRKNIDPVITGDRVLWFLEKNNFGVVVGHLPRKSLLFKPENAYRNKLIAANLDAIIIVTSPPPILSEYMIDRYLVAAEVLNIQPVILLNKIDLLTSDTEEKVTEQLKAYERMGYTVLFSSIRARKGLSQLDDFLKDKTCVLVGASGVGKSSIISALTNKDSIQINEVSASTGLGKHTTTTTRLYHLPYGGNIIDSPGVREFVLWNISKEELLAGFVEFKPFFNQCKYRDCQHQKEPGCIIREAVAKNELSARRFESYLKILADLSERQHR